MTKEFNYQPFIAEFGETKQKGIIKRPYVEKIGHDKPIRIYARLNRPWIRVEMDYDRLKEMK